MGTRKSARDSLYLQDLIGVGETVDLQEISTEGIKGRAQWSQERNQKFHRSSNI